MQTLLFLSLVFGLVGIAALVLKRQLGRKTQELSAAHHQLQATLDALPDLLFEIDQHGRYLAYYSPRTDLLAAPPQALMGRTLHDVLPRQAADTCMAAILEAGENGFAQGQQIALNLADGPHWFELSVARKPGEPNGTPTFIVLSRDITRRKADERQLARMNRLYDALSQCNQAIVRCTTEQELFDVLCRDAVTLGGMKMAWIGQVDQATGRVAPTASFGEGVEYVAGIDLSIDASLPQGRGPTGVALREDRAYWCQDFQRDPATSAWHERGARFGWAASAALPLHCKGRVVGVMSLYADEVNAFDAPEQKLLLEMAMDISFALDQFADQALMQQTAAQLRDSEARYRTAFYTSPDAVNINRLSDGLYLDVNEGFERLTGWSRDEVIGKTSADISIWQSPADRSRLVEALQRDAFCANLEANFVTKDGKTVNGLMSARVIDVNGETCILSMTRDVTNMREAQASLRKLSLAVEQSPNSIVITDLEGHIEYVNTTFSEITGYRPEEVLGQNPRILQSGKTPRARYAELWAHLTAGKPWQGELINKRKDGTEYIESAQITPVHQPDGTVSHYLAIKQDITAQRQDEARIQQLAYYDQLTGLPNRALLQDRFANAISLAQRSDGSLTVMFLDLDHFKNINDTLGHSIGDQLLMEVGRRLKVAVRVGDTVSRLGGDEFILVLPALDASGAAQVARKLIDVVSAPFQFEVHELVATPSIGIAQFPQDGQDAETLFKKADAAMYQAKQAGRNDFRFYTQTMQVNSVRHLRLATDLHHALARHELFVLYQPQVAMQDGRLVGAEALLRWQHPELGLVSPAEFIPIAEATGLIIPIGEWVLRTAAQQVRTWLASGWPDLTVAVNLSAVQFRQRELFDRVTGILADVDVPAHALEIELTEAMAMDDPVAAMAVLERLHGHGIRLSIDDFGTGYSSLSYLKRFRVYKLKIDQSFVRDIGTDPEDKAIVTAIIHMASSLGMRTIAEGVETAEQLDFLRLQGCDEAQGYYFSRPVSAADFEAAWAEGGRSSRHSMLS